VQFRSRRWAHKPPVGAQQKAPCWPSGLRRTLPDGFFSPPLRRRELAWVMPGLRNANSGRHPAPLDPATSAAQTVPRVVGRVMAKWGRLPITSTAAPDRCIEGTANLSRQRPALTANTFWGHRRGPGRPSATPRAARRDDPRPDITNCVCRLPERAQPGPRVFGGQLYIVSKLDRPSQGRPMQSDRGHAGHIGRCRRVSARLAGAPGTDHA